MKYELHTLKNNIKALRVFSGANQEEAACSLNLSRSTYASYEAGLRTPDLITLQKLSVPYLSVRTGLFTDGRSAAATDLLYEKRKCAARGAAPL